MGLRSRNKVKADFNMSSLTDIIFLLLIFLDAHRLFYRLEEMFFHLQVF